MAVDGHQRSVPIPNETLGSQGRYGSGARSEPQDGQGPGRRDVPFGPEISWPYGFRQLDPESREVLESAYGTARCTSSPPWTTSATATRVTPTRPTRARRPRTATPRSLLDHGNGRGNGGAPRDFGGAGYRPPGPPACPDTRSPRSAIPPRQLPGTRLSGFRLRGPGRQPQSFAPPSGSGQEIWPVTGAQEALPDTGPQPARAGGLRRGAAHRVPGAVVRESAAGRPGPRRREPVAVGRPAAGRHDLRRAALRRPGAG